MLGELSDLLATTSADAIPAFFFAHGSPALLKESGMHMAQRLPSDFQGGHDGAQADFLKSFGSFLLSKYKPKGIVVFSAHWETKLGESIEIMDNDAQWQSNNLYYDYYGFPKEMYDLRLTTKTDSALSARVKQLLTEAKIPTKIVHNERGLDHGVFVPFKHMFGDSVDVPIVEVSQYVDASANIAIGQAISQLRKEGILILSGGLTIHTFQDFEAFAPSSAKQGYKDFEAKLLKSINEPEYEQRASELIKIQSDPWFKLAHPTIEHFTPIYIALGAGRSSIPISDLHGAISVAFD